MKNMKYFLLFVIVLLVVVSCKKETTERKTFKEIITSKRWVKSSWTKKLGDDPNDVSTEPIINLMSSCDSKVSITFGMDGTYKEEIATEYKNDIECKDYDEFSKADVWDMPEYAKYIIVGSTNLLENTLFLNIKSYNEKEIIFYYQVFDPMGFGKSYVEIVKLVPFK